ncbi:hypothetical protein [Limnoglobus roseus]|uniref:Uncharacterized protein n=1 Tax=Limnoglobus roseus TaxID=2598579 RepID=A0A5C1APX5_9BACT|nr:hypothetical protein [Limnoglobus roseus]QEL19284.1 hypothetical protein PX52LOC_06347 [Limnoglobus roseus]
MKKILDGIAEAIADAKPELAAAGRQGTSELAQVLPAFPSQGMTPVETMGTVGNPTPQEVTQDRAAVRDDFRNDYDTFLAERAETAQQVSQDKGKEPEIDME